MSKGKNQDDLTWLAINISTWHYFSDAIATVNDFSVTWLDPNKHSESDGFTVEQWSYRRNELWRQR